jgi:hypothetical protein
VTAEALRRRRATAQRLGAPRSTPAAVVAHLLAVQAQDLRAARLALRARGGAGSAAEVDAALAGRDLVLAWLLRGTLHLVARDDYGWLHALTGHLTERTNRRRLAQLGVPDPVRGLAVIERALTDGPLDRPALADRLGLEGQAVPHLIALAASAGTIVPTGAGYALTHDWLGPVAPPPEREQALAELARRYLRGHGPATAADLAAWSGLGLRDARAGLAAVGDEAEADGPPTPPALLPAFDPYLLGWKDRSFAVPEALAKRVHPGGGIIRATAVRDGAVVGTWTMPDGRVALDPPDDAFAAEVAAVEAF